MRGHDACVVDQDVDVWFGGGDFPGYAAGFSDYGEVSDVRCMIDAGLQALQQRSGSLTVTRY